MNIQAREKDHVVIVTPMEKRLDVTVAPDFKAKLSNLIGKGTTRIALDMSNIQFIDSGGLGSIISTLKLLNGKGTLAVFGANQTVVAMLKLTRMDQYLKLQTTEEDALKILSY